MIPFAILDFCIQKAGFEPCSQWADFSFVLFFSKNEKGLAAKRSHEHFSDPQGNWPL